MASLKISMKSELPEDVAGEICTENFVRAAFIPFGFFSDIL
jgi:hypothetical protein